MSEFKNGAKVRIVTPNYDADKFRVGDVGRVYEVERLTGMFCPEGHNPEISHDDLEGTLCFSLSSLELVEDDQGSEVTVPKVQPNILGGIKFDQGKVDYTYLLKDLPVSVEEVTKVLIYGANKYSRSNYSKVESERYEAAALRHIMAYLQGEKLDVETGYHHLAHATCCLMFLVEREVGVAK